MRTFCSTLLLVGAASAALADSPIYREVFPNNTGGTANMSASGSLDTGWFMHTTAQGIAAHPFQDFQLRNDLGANTADEYGLPSPGGVAPVNSNPIVDSVRNGFILNDFGGEFWRSNTLYWTSEYTIDPDAVELTRVTWAQSSVTGFYEGDDRPADPSRIALRVGEAWYASTQTFESKSEPFAMRFFDHEGSSFNLSGASYHPLNFVEGTTLAVDTGTTVSIPSGLITGFGLYWDKSDDRNAFDTFTIWANPAAPQWNNALGGEWTAGANWTTNSAPNAAGATARFGPVISEPTTVLVNESITVGRIEFNSPVSYTLSGAGPLLLDNPAGEARIVLSAGNHSIQTAVILPSNTVIEGAAGTELSVLFLRGAAVQADTTVRLIPGGGPGQLTGITVGALGLLDIHDNAMIINYDDASPALLIMADILAGRIVSGASSDATAIAVVEASDLGISEYDSLVVDGTSVIFRNVLKGDTDLDLAVGFPDLLTLAQNYNSAGGWASGDFDGDEVIGFSDLLSLAQNYGSSLLSDGSIAVDALTHARFGSDWAMARSVVPEPASLALVVAAGLLLRRR
jgi:hypothetical protein